MSSKRALSISLEDLKARTDKALEAAKGKYPSIDTSKLEFSFRPDPPGGTIGYREREGGGHVLSNATAQDLQSLCTDIANEVSDLVPESRAVTIIDHNGPTMGFFPV